MNRIKGRNESREETNQGKKRIKGRNESREETNQGKKRIKGRNESREDDVSRGRASRDALLTLAFHLTKMACRWTYLLLELG
jgi:hypothetical protein